MRVALLSWESMHSIAVGGVGAHVSELATALTGKGHIVHVFTRRGNGQAGHELIDGVHYHRCTYLCHGDFVEDVNNMCRSFVDRVFDVEDLLGRFDIIHAHDWLAANAMIWIKQGRGHKCLLTIHSTEYGRCGNVLENGRSVRVRAQERAGTYWADRVIAVSKATQGEIARMYDVPDWKTSVVYNGVNPQRFDKTTDPGEDKRRHHIGPLDPTILFCGRLALQKGPDLLVEAIPSILRLHSRAKIVFAGDGEMRGVLESRVRQLGVGHAVRFLGCRNGDELVHLFKLADVVCVPSRNEPFGIVVIEAWSAGKPVIVSQNGGPNEYVTHEVDGLKIYPQPDSVVWGVGRIFSDFDRARWMGRNGRKTVEERFAWDTIAEQTLAVYRQLCPSPIPMPKIEPRRIRTLVRKPSSAARWNGVPDEDLVRAGYENVEECAPVYVQASLCFRATGRAGEASNALEACMSSLARSGLKANRQDHHLTIKGDMETVMTALNRCYMHLQRTGLYRKGLSDQQNERVAFNQTSEADDLVLVAR